MPLEKILIVEDEPVVRNLLLRIFERHKFSVAIATNLAEASAAVQRESYDLMMLDIRLPDGDGQKFLEQMVALPERPQAPAPFGQKPQRRWLIWITRFWT